LIIIYTHRPRSVGPIYFRLYSAVGTYLIISRPLESSKLYMVLVYFARVKNKHSDTNIIIITRYYLFNTIRLSASVFYNTNVFRTYLPTYYYYYYYNNHNSNINTICFWICFLLEWSYDWVNIFRMNSFKWVLLIRFENIYRFNNTIHFSHSQT